MFVNTLTADYKYSNSNVQNFQQQVQTSLCQTEMTFSRFFIAFLMCAWIVKHFEEKEEYPSLIISEIIESQRGGYLNI